MRNRIILLTILCALSIRAIAQTYDNGTLPGFPFNAHVMDLSKIEKKDDQLKAQFIKAQPAFFANELNYMRENTKEMGDRYNGMDSLKHYLHVYDINGDGRNDLIYTGVSGGEPSEVALILNTPQGFKLVFRKFQYLLKFNVENNRITKLYIDDPGCCASYIMFNEAYDVKYQGNMPSFKLSYFTAYHYITQIPTQYFSSPIPFEVLNNGYKMRVAPEINDNTQLFMDDMPKGNTVCELSKGTHGVALAEATDKTGRVWWFVQLDAAAKVSKDQFYDEDGINYKPGKMGWISSRFVKRLDN
jgi:hypothetical protein